ncbi:hypothetical protein ACLMJK_007938 [Lecanora helva]
MSRSYRRPSDYSLGNSPRIDRNLAVTEATFQNLGLSETAGTPHLTVPSTYQTSNRRRPSTVRPEVSSSDYLSPNYDPTTYRATSPAYYSNPNPSSTFGSSVISSDYDQLFADPTTYPDRASPFSTSSLNRNTMGYANLSVASISTTDGFGSYPSYQDAVPSGYRDTSSYGASSRSPSQRDYTTEASLSRSMSGPPGPSILPSSAYGGFRDAEREVARQRRRNVYESRRQSKLLMRRTMLPSTPGIRPSEVEILSGPIDSSVAQSSASYDSHSAYGRTPSTSSGHGGYHSTLSA